MNKAEKLVKAIEDGQCILTLLTITHPLLSSPVRLVNGTADIDSCGERFKAFPFEIVYPEDSDWVIHDGKKTLFHIQVKVFLDRIGIKINESSWHDLRGSVDLVERKDPDDVIHAIPSTYISLIPS